ncbi:MAG: LemA family protein [Brumimicrobium sp.]|nr:LemA family protein [Brumimicrobium sp.]
MKKALIIGAILVILIIFVSSVFIIPYNNMVNMEENVTKQWSQVENVYQRRADLIPNLVATVKGYAEHEKSTLEGVVSARAKATSINISADNLSEESIEKYQAAQGELSQALGKLLMIQENYPELKANENFRDLQAQLEGTENRITVERMKFNEEAQKYNTYIRSFPKNMIAGMFGFDKKPYFKAKEGADEAPTVQF